MISLSLLPPVYLWTCDSLPPFKKILLDKKKKKKKPHPLTVTSESDSRSHAADVLPVKFHLWSNIYWSHTNTSFDPEAGSDWTFFCHTMSCAFLVRGIKNRSLIIPWCNILLLGLKQRTLSDYTKKFDTECRDNKTKHVIWCKLGLCL